MVTADTGRMHIGFSMKSPVVDFLELFPGPYEIPDHLWRATTINPEEVNGNGKADWGGFYFGSIKVEQVWVQVEEMLVENFSL
jgi:hypothetical protein